MELFTKTVYGCNKPLTIFAKSYLLAVWQGSEYVLGIQPQFFKQLSLWLMPAEVTIGF